MYENKTNSLLTHSLLVYASKNMPRKPGERKRRRALKRAYTMRRMRAEGKGPVFRDDGTGVLRLTFAKGWPRRFVAPGEDVDIQLSVYAK